MQHMYAWYGCLYITMDNKIIVDDKLFHDALRKQKLKAIVAKFPSFDKYRKDSDFSKEVTNEYTCTDQ